MSSFEEIRIISIDEARPPRVRKEAYIDLFFKLSHKAPLDWCEEFNALGRQINPAAKIDKNLGESTRTWRPRPGCAGTRPSGGRRACSPGRRSGA